MTCCRGEVYWVDWPEGRGSEQRGRRPALVVQNDRGNRSSPTTVLAAISSAPLPRVYPFTVILEAGEAGLPIPCHVNCAHLMTVDQGRLRERAGDLSPDKVREVQEALRYELDL